jgi:hypothetical protein
VAISSPQTGAAAELRGFIERYIAAWNGFDADAIAQLSSEAWPEHASGSPAAQLAAARAHCTVRTLTAR